MLRLTHNSNAVYEPQVVRVFASLAAIKEAKARRLLERAAARYGAYISRSGDVSCKDKDTFGRVWDNPCQQLREVS